MAVCATLAQAELNEIAEEVAKSLPPPLEAFASSLEIGASFEVWTLASLSAPDLLNAMRFTGAFHHQLLSNGGAVGYARSRKDGLRWDVSVFVSDLAVRLGEAIDQADPLVTQDCVTRLFIAEQYQLYALWFDGAPQELFVLASFGAISGSIDPGFIVGTEMLQRLRQTHPRIGVKFDRTRPI
jgi:hypothetical protein